MGKKGLGLPCCGQSLPRVHNLTKKKELMFEMRARSIVDEDLPEVLVGSLTT